MLFGFYGSGLHRVVQVVVLGRSSFEAVRRRGGVRFDALVD